MDLFLDAFAGSDANTGLSWAQAWKTLDKLLAQICLDNTLGVSGPYRDYDIDVYIKSGIYFAVTSLDMTLGNFDPKYKRFNGVGHVVFRNPMNGFIKLQDRWNGQTITLRNINFINMGSWLRAATSYDSGEHQFENCGFVGPVKAGIANFNGVMRFINCRCATGVVFPTNGVTYPLGDTTTLVIPTGASWTPEASQIVKIASETGGTYVSPGLIAPASVNSLEPLTGCFNCLPDKYQSSATGGSFVELPAAATRLFTVTGGNNFLPSTLGWIKDPASSGTITVSDTSGVTLASGDGVSFLSPVYLFNYGIILRGVGMNVVEFSDDGEYQVIDKNPATALRTIEVRSSDSPFLQTDVSPSWVEITRKTINNNILGKYVQLRMTFQLHAVG